MADPRTTSPPPGLIEFVCSGSRVLLPARTVVVMEETGPRRDTVRVTYTGNVGTGWLVHETYDDFVTRLAAVLALT